MDYPRAEGSTADNLAWALRHVYDRFHAARGIQAVDELIRDLQRSGLPLMRDLVVWPLLLAIKHGNIVFQANDLHGCAELHHFTARRVCQLIDELLPSSAPSEEESPVRAFHQSLQILLKDYPAVDAASSGKLAWTFYETFLRMLQSSRE